ncbi:hypothetical protein JTB14_037567 [Gonioctena quinquepunctata]|nr:hypothetical protein JTB14_037567 [Gonioctena quinquepunctata]
MVLGQTEAVSSIQSNVLQQNDDTRSQFDTSGPPEGLHRMVPGESSSPENSTRRQQQEQDENDSESEFNQLVQHAPQPRSATIGADTPPATANPTGSPPLLPSNRSQVIGGAENQTRSNATPASDKGIGRSVKEPERRNYIEGQTDENEVANITNSVRNMTVGENLTDGQMSNNSLPEPAARRLSRQESSDSDRDHKKPPRSSRDKRSAERLKRDKERERESDKNRDRDRGRYADPYRDKKYERRRYKDRRYEEDTDYNSDKERRAAADREYERKYSSLRKEKDKDKRRRDPRDYRRGEYYYSNRYDDEYENEGRSRPSSRSDSMHESYRERPLEKDHRDKRLREKEKERYRRHRDPRDMYNPYQGFSYDPYNPYYQQYQYYENLRRTNPQAYADWYRKYYQQATGQTSSYGGEDRASVHSGRSSANDELAKDRYTRQSFYSQMSVPHHGSYYGDTHAHSVSGHYGHDTSSFSRPFDNTDSSMNFDDTNLTAQRLTPAKFATAHSKASIASGKFLRILPHYPMDGQNATVEICNLQSLLLNDQEYRELSEFPGPLVKGSTHKKTIIEYCENKIKDASYNRTIVDVESYVLMWELLILLIRQNGMVVGTDIAELLLNKRELPPPRPSSIISSMSSNNGEANPTSEASNLLVSENTGSMMSVLKEEEVTNKFREFLLYGSGKEALEWAMKHGLWGHALFLASKLDKRTYANVMMRFANGLTLNDPLQTLYQLLSGKMPAAVTCVFDDKWGDWRPHLAMILSNSTQPPELSLKAVTTLGDTLLSRGSLYAAQFCYLMAEVGFGQHDSPETRLVLLGADHRKPYPCFATNEAVHMTEIYEYACGLNNPDFVLPHFQIYKYLLSTRLADRGLLEKALAYLENIAGCIDADPASVQASLVDNVCALADRLKFCDPVGEVEDESEFGGILETNRPDHSWLKRLRAIQNDFQTGLITHQSVQNLEEFISPAVETDPNQTLYVSSSGQESWQQQYEPQYRPNETLQPQPWQPDQSPQVPQAEYVQDNQLLQQNDYSSPGLSRPAEFLAESATAQQSFYGSNAQVEPKEVQKDVPEVSKPNLTDLSPFSLPPVVATSLRKRLTPHSPTLDALELQKLKPHDTDHKQQPLSRNDKTGELRKEELVSDSSDLELETYVGRRRQKNVTYKNEEKSQLICYKDNDKVITIKNDSRHTKYNTFDMKSEDKKGKLVKYKSLDIPDTKAVVKYLEPNSKVSISAEDFGSNYRVSKFDRKRHRHDIITDTVDAWAKKGSKNSVFTSLKNSLFKGNSEKEIVYKPLVFGGTYPIDCPTLDAKTRERKYSATKRDGESAKKKNALNAGQVIVALYTNPQESPQPQISLPNQFSGGATNNSYEEEKPESKNAVVAESRAKPKAQSPLQEKTQSTGWFGGIFSKLALKPKNQMKLPDDKNPKIVWDQDKKRWTNVDEDPSDTATEFKPPPKMADIMPKMAPLAQSTPGNMPLQSQPSSLPNAMTPNLVPTEASLQEDGANAAPKSTQPNMFKLQRGRNLKNSYIDVFNPSSKPGGGVPLADVDKVGSMVPQMNFFVPQPADPNAPVDFLTPGGVPHMGEQQPQ